MKLAYVLLTLAAVLSVAAPVFADSLTVEITSKDRDSSFAQRTIDKREFSEGHVLQSVRMYSLEEAKVRTDAESGVSTSDSSPNEKISEFAAFLTSGMDSDNGPVKLFDFDANTNPFNEHSEKARGKHRKGNGFGANGKVFLVSVPEPGSQTLLLFGIAGLGLLLFRRNNLSGAIA